jgi:hypothetical protein
MVIDRILRSLGLSYTTRHHLGRTVKGTDWGFLAAVLLLLGVIGVAVVKLA